MESISWGGQNISVVGRDVDNGHRSDLCGGGSRALRYCRPLLIVAVVYVGGARYGCSHMRD